VYDPRVTIEQQQGNRRGVDKRARQARRDIPPIFENGYLRPLGGWGLATRKPIRDEPLNLNGPAS